MVPVKDWCLCPKVRFKVRDGIGLNGAFQGLVWVVHGNVSAIGPSSPPTVAGIIPLRQLRVCLLYPGF